MSRATFVVCHVSI